MKDNTQDKLSNYVSEIDRLKRLYEQAKGEVNARFKIMKEDFGVVTLATAKKKLSLMKREFDNGEKNLTQRLRTFEEKFSDYVER